MERIALIQVVYKQISDYHRLQAYVFGVGWVSASLVSSGTCYFRTGVAEPIRHEIDDFALFCPHLKINYSSCFSPGGR